MAWIRGSRNADTVSAEGVSTSVRGGPATDGADCIATGRGDDEARGGGGGDVVRGGGGADHLWGDGGNDCLLGGPGDDCLWGGTGNDRLLGGSGFDEAVYVGVRSDYDVHYLDDGTVTVRDLQPGNLGVNEGFDTLTGIERIRFTGSEPSIVRASSSAAGERGNFYSDEASLSDDGTKLTFTSGATNLGPPASGVALNVLVKDLVTGQITSSNTTANGEPGNGFSHIPIISADGTKVAFEALSDNLVPGSAGEPGSRTSGVYVKDLVTGAVTRADVTEDGTPSNGSDWFIDLSPDGTKVAFWAYQSPLFPNPGGQYDGILVKDLVTGAITVVNTSASGERANGISHVASGAFSADGTKIVFDSDAGNLVPGDTNGQFDVFIKDLRTGSIDLVSTTQDGGLANAASTGPVISDDGTKVAFTSSADNLTGSMSREYQVFVKDLVTGEVTQGSALPGGTWADGPSFQPALSGDGTKLAFSSSAGNLAPGTFELDSNIFLKDLVTGEVALLSPRAEPDAFTTTGSPAVNGDGSVVAFSSSADFGLGDPPDPTRDTFETDVYVYRSHAPESVIDLG